MALASPLSAQQSVFEANAGEKAPSDGAVTFAPSAVERLALADKVSLYAQVSGNPVAYVIAANLYLELGISQRTRPAQNGATVSEGFWEEARTSVANDAWAQSELQRAMKRQRKGNVVGPSSFTMGAAPSNNLISLKYVGGSPAIFYARPNPGRQVRLTVFDQNGAITCKTEWSGFGAICRWTPRWTGAFRVQVESPDTQTPVSIATN